MREARYPLDAVRIQRDHLRSVAELALRDARAELERAEAALSALESAWQGVEARRAQAQTRAASGHGLDVTRAGRYAARLAAELRAIGPQLRAAQECKSQRARAVRVAELVLQQAHAERELVERHHARFREAERKALERAQELEIEEQNESARFFAGTSEEAH